MSDGRHEGGVRRAQYRRDLKTVGAMDLSLREAGLGVGSASTS
jgi:hypothetical protein